MRGWLVGNVARNVALAPGAGRTTLRVWHCAWNAGLGVGEIRSSPRVCSRECETWGPVMWGNKGRETVGNAVRPAADSQATGQATTASQWQSSDPAPGPTVAPVAMLRTSPIQLTAGMRKRPGRRRRSNRRCKERAKRASRSAGGYEGAVGCLAWFLFLSATSWTMVRITWCAASRRTPEERSSTPVPHHAAGGLVLVGTNAGRARLDPWRTVRVGDADRGRYFIWNLTQLNVRPYSRAGLLRYKIAPGYPLPGPFNHSGVGRGPEVAGPIRSYNLVFTYPCQGRGRDPPAFWRERLEKTVNCIDYRPRSRRRERILQAPGSPRP